MNFEKLCELDLQSISGGGLAGDMLINLGSALPKPYNYAAIATGTLINNCPLNSPQYYNAASHYVHGYYIP